MKKYFLIILITLLWCRITFAQAGIEGQTFAFGISSSLGIGIGDETGVTWLNSLKLKINENKIFMIRGGLISGEAELGDIAIIYRHSYCKGVTKKSSKFLFDDKNQKFLKVLYYSRLRPFLEGGVGTSLSGGGGIELYFTKQISLEIGANLIISLIADDGMAWLVPKIELTFWPF